VYSTYWPEEGFVVAVADVGVCRGCVDVEDALLCCEMEVMSLYEREIRD
jgi:hypothetical protein